VRRGVALAALVVALASAPGAVGAHAALDRADPRPNSTVRGAPGQVRLWFTEKLETAFSTARVVNAAGKSVGDDGSRLDAENAALLVVPLKPLGAGSYTVIWRVLSVDSHVTEGRFSFRVAP
jgi:methionine-rich copper-binding protein CopC